MPSRRPVPQGLQQPCTSIESLPDPLLGLVFAAAGRRAGKSITLVSHRWHRIFFSEPALWRQLALTAESLERTCDKRKAAPWFSCKTTLLRRVGRLVQRLRYTELLKYQDPVDSEDELWFDMQGAAAEHYWTSGSWRLSSSVLVHLSPGALQSLHPFSEHADGEAMKALRRFSGLTKLSVKCLAGMDYCVAAALPSLPQLQCLKLSGRGLPAALPTALSHLPNLTCLSCRSREQLLGLSAVLALSQLRTLEAWAEDRWDGTLQPDVPQLVARLPHLESWAFESMAREDCSGSLQVGGALLYNCRVSGYDRASGTVEQLRLGFIHEVPSLQQLVAGLLPASTPPIKLRSLTLNRCDLPLPAMQDCSCLEQLTSLALFHCSFLNGGDEEGTASLLRQARQLRSLTLLFSQQGLQHLEPSLLCDRTGLLHLRLKGSGMADLPPGPYLASLKSLDLSQNKFKRLPGALAAAISLEELSLDGNSELALTRADVDEVLLHSCLRLRRLHLGATRTEASVLQHLSSRAPELKVLEGPKKQ